MVSKPGLTLWHLWEPQYLRPTALCSWMAQLLLYCPPHPENAGQRVPVHQCESHNLGQGQVLSPVSCERGDGHWT